MGTVIPEAAFLSALGASPYAAAAPSFLGGLFGTGAAAGAGEAAASGLLTDSVANGGMGMVFNPSTGTYLNPAMYIGESTGMPLFTGAGSFGDKLAMGAGSLKDAISSKIGGNGLSLAAKGIGMIDSGQQQQPQATNAQVNSMPRQGMGGMSSFSEAAPESQRARLEEEMMKKQQWLQGLGYAGR